MLKCSVISIVASALLVAGLSIAPVQAGGLLGTVTDTVGSVTDTVTDTVDDLTGGGGGGLTDTLTDTVGDLTGGTGGTGLDDVVTVNNTTNNGVANINTNGTSGGLTASLGKTNKGLPSVNVTTGLLKTVLDVLDLSGLGLDLNVDLGILNPGNPNTGGPSNPARPGEDPNQPVLVGSLDGGNTFIINCTVNNTRQVLQVAANGKIDAAEIRAWQRSANVQIVPMKLCPAARKQVAAILSKSPKMNLLQRAVMADALIAASLGRTKYDAGDVVAVQRKGGQLVVYVY